MRFFFKSTC